MDFQRIGMDVFSIMGEMMGEELDHVSCVNVMYSKGKGIIVIVSLNDLDIDMYKLKETVLSACGRRGIIPIGIYLDI